MTPSVPKRHYFFFTWVWSSSLLFVNFSLLNVEWEDKLDEFNKICLTLAIKASNLSAVLRKKWIYWGTSRWEHSPGSHSSHTFKQKLSSHFTQSVNKDAVSCTIVIIYVRSFFFRHFCHFESSSILNLLWPTWKWMKHFPFRKVLWKKEQSL